MNSYTSNPNVQQPRSVAVKFDFKTIISENCAKQ